jgi:transposase-like protein
LDNFRQGIDMAQHFLKSAALRDFSVGKVANMSEWDCFQTFVNIRWGGFQTAVCSECGVIDRHYFRRTRKQWRCKHCDAYFSVTTHSPFENHQLSFKQMLLGIMLFISSANGISIHRLSRDMDVAVKTAQVFMGKLRECLYDIRNQDVMQGLIHMDGGHFGGKPRNECFRKKSNKAIKAHVEAKLQAVKKSRRIISPKNRERLKKRRIVMVLRELFPQGGLGGRKTITAVCMGEDQSYAESLAKRYIKKDSNVMTDEGVAFAGFSEWFDHQTVPHAQMFQTLDEVDNNQAESYFSRLRRYALGVGHRIEPKYMADIANEMAWREDVRRQTQRYKLEQLLGGAFKYGRSQWWRGYWQGINRPGEILWDCTSNAPLIQGS